ncbi:hypothetical protein [Citricoccus sp. I39-566]|uniref:hypothetical protein n=1 Tax=Citricoccus sp. I39-566 TaxID=3073268 RepID=UPI00286D60DC|nr:hypothetical protein [Citricoccus sp. I39-566]WMY78564.1 hypothetical protein RE421_01485 [Citricoccus sp. I39-566]
MTNRQRFQLLLLVFILGAFGSSNVTLIQGAGETARIVFGTAGALGIIPRP